MKPNDIEKLIRFEIEVTISDLLQFKDYAPILFNDIKLHGLLQTMHHMSEENRLRLIEIIEDY